METETETVKTVKHTLGKLSAVPTNDERMPFYIHEEPKFKHEGAEGFIILQTVSVGDAATDKAIAEFIVRACNSHYELLELLKKVNEAFSISCSYSDWVPTKELNEAFDLIETEIQKATK